MVKIEKPKDCTDKKEDLLLVSQCLDLETTAWESGFYQRTPKKITVSALLISFWMMQQVGKNTLRNWAIQLGIQIGQPLTKQSLNERLDEKAVAFAKITLNKALNSKVNKKEIRSRKKQFENLLRPFNRILIRDSTTQQLPSHLSENFPGSYSHGQPTAIMRIQALFNFSEENWEDFHISAYTNNDQSAAACIAEFLQPNDLILQDLGYFTLDWIQQLIEHQYLITKWDNATLLFNANGEKINLPELLQNKTEIDVAVLVGSKKRIPMRLVARKLPKAKAAKRIESARKDRHSKSNHSEQYYELLKYEIYLTNISQETLNGKQIAKLYGLRWYIEILFKSWKSYANFKKMFNKERMNLHRTQFTIYAILIEMVYLTRNIYRYIKKRIPKITNEQMSILKFTDVANDLMKFILNIKSIEYLDPLIPHFAKHATHDKYPKRKNTMNKYLYVKQLCIKKF